MTRVLRRTLQVERAAYGWLLGVLALVGVTVGSWPAVAGSGAELEGLLEELPPAVTALFGEGIASFSAASVVGSRLFGSIGLALFIGYAISRGARAIAGEEAAGTLELLVTQPVRRTDVALAKVLATWLGLAALVLVQHLLLLVASPLVDLGFAVGHVVEASVGLYLLAALFGMLAYAVGAASGNRSLAVGVAATTAGTLFLLAGLGRLVPDLEPLAELSPFTAFDGTIVLADGVAVVPVVLFGLVAVVFTALGTAAFDRRDLT